MSVPLSLRCCLRLLQLARLLARRQLCQGPAWPCTRQSNQRWRRCSMTGCSPWRRSKPSC
jgi:hypothetical protein